MAHNVNEEARRHTGVSLLEISRNTNLLLPRASCGALRWLAARCGGGASWSGIPYRDRGRYLHVHFIPRKSNARPHSGARVSNRENEFMLFWKNDSSSFFFNGLLLLYCLRCGSRVRRTLCTYEMKLYKMTELKKFKYCTLFFNSSRIFETKNKVWLTSLF